MCEFRNNSAWALVKVGDTEESFGVVLLDTYGKGQMLTLAVPDSFPDLYKLPAEALTRLRREFPAGRCIWSAAPGSASLPMITAHSSCILTRPAPPSPPRFGSM